MADAPVMFDQLPEDQAATQMLPSNANNATDMSQVSGQASGQMGSFDSMVDDSQQYETPGQQLATGAEGLAKGVLGPLAPYLEKKLLKVPGSEQRARAEANPVAAGVGQAAGLVGSALTGVGEGAIMAKAGEAAAEAAGLAQATSVTAKIGSEAVKQAAEMAVLQSSDEVGKLIINDPDTSAQSALANVGLATAIGGAGGAVFGAVNPLWKATVGNKVEKVLGGIKDHLDGVVRLGMPEDIEKASQTLGVQLSPELRSAMSGDPRAASLFNELREAQHTGVTEQLKHLDRNINDSVINSLGKSTEEIANYSEAEGGRHAMDTFKKEYQAKYEPISKEYDSLTQPFQESKVSNAQIGTLSDKISQIANERGYLGPQIPQNKVVDWLLNRLPSVKSVQDYSKISTELRNITQGDMAMLGVRRDMSKLIQEAQHDALSSTIGTKAPELMSRYTAVRSAYGDLANISGQLGQDLGLGKFVGPKSLLETLASKRSPEQFLSRLSPKGNAEIIGFLEKHFPETLESIRDNELKQLLKPAVLGAKGESPINSRILNNAIERGLAGQPERIKFAMPKGSLEKIEAANMLLKAVPEMKSSGTAGWQQKMMAHVPQSALAAVAMVTGHNPIFGYIGGHIGKLLARDVPDAMKLGLLRFMSADQPLKAEGFKAMVDFLANVSKGQTILNRATANVVKSGAQVLTDKEMPSKADREKLNEFIEKVNESPDIMMKFTQGDVGHYLPAHQTALTQSQVQAVQYLQSLKPHPFQASPLDKPIEPNHADKERYNRALDIANQPMFVLRKVKDGTLSTNDIQDLNTMYPSLAQQMRQKVSDAMMNKHSDEEHIPYKTKMGISLFLGQPMDTTMTPMAIMSAQPKKSGNIPPQGQQQGQPKGNMSKLGKSNKMYQTPGQAAEERRQKND